MTKGKGRKRTVSAVTLGIDCARCLDRRQSPLAKFLLRILTHIQRVVHRRDSSWAEADASMMVHVHGGSHAYHEVVGSSPGVQTNYMHLEVLQVTTVNPYEVVLSYVGNGMEPLRYQSS